MTSQNDAAAYHRLNSLQNDYSVLKVKYENQNQLLESLQGKVHELELKLQESQNKLANIDEENNDSASPQKLLQLENRLASSDAHAQALQAELDSVMSALEASSKHTHELNRRYDDLEQAHTQIKSLAATTERNLQASQAENTQMKERIAELKDTLDQCKQRMASMEEQCKQFDAMESARDGAVEEMKRMEKVVEDLTTTQATNTHRLQNELQHTRQLLEEIKVEYEQYSTISRLEFEAERKALSAEYQELVEEFENHKLRELESTQNLLREQEEIVHALQRQFSEYRKTAEALFYSEAQKLETGLRAQALKFDQEMASVIQAKDQLFVQMVTSKDAKIMSLVEGTDMQKLLTKHESDIEQLKQQHQRDLQMVKEIAQSEQRKKLNRLKEDVAKHSVEAEKARNEIKIWKAKVDKGLTEFKQYKIRMATKEQQHAKILQERQDELNEAYRQKEQLKQVKENLRHRILRLRLQLEGRADDSLDSVVTRLTLESKKMKKRLASITALYKAKVAETTKLHRQLERAHKAKDELHRQVAIQTQEYAHLTAAFEHMLSGRLYREAGHTNVSGAAATAALPADSSGARSRRAGDERQGLLAHQASDAKEPAGSASGDEDPRRRLQRLIKAHKTAVGSVLARAATLHKPPSPRQVAAPYKFTAPASILKRNLDLVDWTAAHDDVASLQAAHELKAPSARLTTADSNRQDDAPTGFVVDDEVVTELEHGFVALDRFKELSRRMQADPFGVEELKKRGLLDPFKHVRAARTGVKQTGGGQRGSRRHRQGGAHKTTRRRSTATEYTSGGISHSDSILSVASVDAAEEVVDLTQVHEAEARVRLQEQLGHGMDVGGDDGKTPDAHKKQVWHHHHHHHKHRQHHQHHVHGTHKRSTKGGGGGGHASADAPGHSASMDSVGTDASGAHSGVSGDTRRVSVVSTSSTASGRSVHPPAATRRSGGGRTGRLQRASAQTKHRARHNGGGGGGYGRSGKRDHQGTSGSAAAGRHGKHTRQHAQRSKRHGKHTPAGDDTPGSFWDSYQPPSGSKAMPAPSKQPRLGAGRVNARRAKQKLPAGFVVRLPSPPTPGKGQGAVPGGLHGTGGPL